MNPWGPVEPRAWQPAALRALRERAPVVPRMLVEACTGSGKSRLIGAVCALTPGPVIVTTPTQALTEQLAATLSEHCPGEVGRAYQHAWELDRRVLVTCAASLARVLAERPTWRRWIADEAHLGLPVIPAAESALGVSATPFRGTRGAGLWDEVVYRYTAAQAERDGVLVPLRAVRVEPGTPVATPEQRETVCRAWVASWDGPGVVSASSCADADAFAASTPDVAAVHQYVPPDLRRERIAALERGDLRALVQVRMLREGVDLPWIRNVLLRQIVASPAALVQFVGRGLRAEACKSCGSRETNRSAVVWTCEGCGAPVKSWCNVYDPYGLLASVGLTHTAAIDEVLADAPEEMAEEWEIPELEGLPGLQGLPEFVVVGIFEGWVEDLYRRVRASGPTYGIELREREALGREWRTWRATDRQRADLERLTGAVVGRLPEGCRAPFRWLLEHPDLRRGPAEDAIDVLRAVSRRWRALQARGGREWRFWRVPGALVPRVPERADDAAMAAGSGR